MARVPLIAGNWKMHMLRREARVLAEAVRDAVGGITDREVALCPPFTALETVADVLAGSPVKLGAQDCFWEEQGAFTGEVSPAMLRDLGCACVILGHSERRRHFGESDDTVNRKARAALEFGLIPIVCVGETLDEREAGVTRTVVERQLRGGLAGVLPRDLGRIVVAYEPVWAIGTGRNDTPVGANETIGHLRSILIDLGGYELAQSIRILYGGSVKPDNMQGFMERPEIDGGLVGGASLTMEQFVEIVTWDRTHPRDPLRGPSSGKPAKQGIP